MSSINEIMRNSMRTNWALTDDFQFTFYNKNRPINVSSGGMSPQDVYDITIMNIDLPQLASSAEQVMQAGEWRIYNAKFEPFTFTITFRDFGSLDLRNYFAAVWMDAQRGYFDDVKSTVKISVGQKISFFSEDCLITSVSTVQLDNTNSQIAEFSVEFTSPYYTNDLIPKFGSDSYRNNKSNPLNLGNIGSSVTESLNGVKSTMLDSLDGVIGTVKNWF